MLTRSDFSWFGGIRAALIQVGIAATEVIERNVIYDDGKLDDFEKLVVVLEDRRFFKHTGVDIQSVIRALLKFVTLRPKGGASTIEMQLVRTVSQRYEKTLRRKLIEALASRIISVHLTKKQVLRQYLQEAYFGTNLTGSSVAFQKARTSPISLSEHAYTLKNTDLEDAALVASQLVYPRPRSTNAQWLKKVRRRADYGIELLAWKKDSFEEI